MRIPAIEVKCSDVTKTKIAEQEPGRRFDLDRFKHDTENPNRALEFLDTIRAKLAAHAALSDNERAYIEESKELDRVDPLFRVEQIVNDYFDLMESGAISPQAARSKLLEFIDMHRTVLRLLNEQERRKR